MTQPKTNKDEALFFRAAFEPTTFVEESRTVELTWTTGASVKRYDWNRDRYYMEQLLVTNDAVDFSRLENGAPLLANHASYNLSDVIGVVERAWIDKGIGKATVRFSERDEVKPILQDVKAGILRSISVGYSIDTVTIEERQNDLPIYTATRWTPMEISLVSIPADVGAQVRSNEIILSTTKEATMPEVTEVRNEQVAPPPAVDLDAVRNQAIQAERERVTEIRSICDNRFLTDKDQFAQRMINDGKSIEETRKAVLDELNKIASTPDQSLLRGGSDIQIVSDETDKMRNAAVDSILGRSGILTAKEKQERLQGNPFTQFRAREIARQCLEMTGANVRGLSDDEIVKRAFTSSTSDFPVILENVLHRTVLASYGTVGETWRRFCATGSVSDFRQWKRLKLASIGSLDSVTELGEFKNKPLSDAESESISVTTFGNIVNISRQMIVNDDLGAFLNISTALGKAAALTVEKAVYSLLLANPTMSDGVALFHATHKNLQSTGTALSVEAIDADRVAMAAQMDVGGNDYLDIKPSVLLVPTALGGTARVINRSEYDPDAANKLQRVNKVAGLFNDIIDTPRLTGTARYYFADPNVMPAFEVAFLNGNDQPYLEQENGFDVDGVKYKVRLDFGVAAIESRAVYKNVGA
jgi:hypothetical protein